MGGTVQASLFTQRADDVCDGVFGREVEYHGVHVKAVKWRANESCCGGHAHCHRETALLLRKFVPQSADRLGEQMVSEVKPNKRSR
jgi:hypothetical protein